MKRQKRRIVVGDIHGELGGFREILSNAKLIDGKDNWVGGDAVLIQTGDVIDRGPYSRETVDLLKRLQKQASTSQGLVARLCGNHELMLLQGHFRYANFSNPRSLANDLRKEIIQGDLQASYTDGERLYTHAGLRSMMREILVDEIKTKKPDLKTYKNGLYLLSDYINGVLMESAKKNKFDGHPIFYADPVRGGTKPVGGIFWCDFSSIGPSSEACIIPQIFGHTLTGANEVKSAQGLRLIDIDAGMSMVYGGKKVYLEITPEGNLVQHSKSRSIWTEKLLRKS